MDKALFWQVLEYKHWQHLKHQIRAFFSHANTHMNDCKCEKQSNKCIYFFLFPHLLNVTNSSPPPTPLCAYEAKSNTKNALQRFFFFFFWCKRILVLCTNPSISSGYVGFRFPRTILMERSPFGDRRQHPTVAV